MLVEEGLVVSLGIIPVVAVAASNLSSKSSSSNHEFKLAQNSPLSLKLLVPCRLLLVLQSLDYKSKSVGLDLVVKAAFDLDLDVCIYD
jgi:hypothetical protein